MALPTSPTTVVIENDASIYAPNVDSSVAGIVGFADKGPINVAKLVTSQNQLISLFGRPNSAIPGQALEGALEILEATNKVYFARAVNSSNLAASANITMGYMPSVQVSANVVDPLTSTTMYYAVYNNAGTLDTSGNVTIASSVGTTNANTAIDLVFPVDNVGESPIFSKRDNSGNVYLVGKFAGSGASIQVSSVDATYLSFKSVDAGGDPNATAATTVTVSGGTASATGASALYSYVESYYPGTGYNLSSLRDGTVVGLSVEVDSKSIVDRLTVNSEGSQKEVFNVVMSPSAANAITYLLSTDDDVNESNLVNCQTLSGAGVTTILPNNAAEKLSLAAAFGYSGIVSSVTPRFVKPLEGTYGLGGGNSGYSTSETGSTADYTALIGTQAAKSGMYALDDDSLNISMALIPGITAQSVQNAMITLAETSKNFVAIMSPPYGLATVQDATNWINGKGDNGRTASVNSSYAACYWPWVQVFNYYAGADEWYDPAIFAARQYCYTDNVSDPWYAPAGYRRGRLLKPSNTEIALNQGDRDSLYENNINPITKENQAGILIFGQKTAQRLPTALNSVNVRRMMVYLRKVLLILGRPFQFEPNDEFTWELVEDAINPLLDDLIARRAIVEGAVACNSETNTPIRIDRKEMWCSITIKPTLAAETVVFEVNLTNQAATING